MIVGLISDTHNLLRPEAIRALKCSDVIIHAGDVGTRDIIHALEAVAPVYVVRGNIDSAPWAQTLPAIATVQTDKHKICVVHDIADLKLGPALDGIDIVVSGHSHKPGSREKDGVLYINPGSAGPRRFRLPVTVALLDTAFTPSKLVLVDLLERDGGPK
jgi:uncharacterized protein